MATHKTVKVPYLKIKVEKVEAFVFKLQQKNLLKIGYVARRGIDKEKGSVQRILSESRVEDIAEFVSKGKNFFSPFILNWVNNTPIQITKNTIQIPLIEDAAQLLDGQHRFMGIKRAYQNKKTDGTDEILVILVKGLETKDAAEIFLNINEKQKTVSKSLIYDLFGEYLDNKTGTVSRARDIAVYLNTTSDSPYFGMIKFPGTLGKRGMLEFSTVVQALEDHVGVSGTFFQRGIETFESQSLIIESYFNAIRIPYENAGLWGQVTKNPFWGAAGFKAGINVLCGSVLEQAIARQSFETKVFGNILALNQNHLLEKDDEDFKSLGGKEQIEFIEKFLSHSIRKSALPEGAYRFDKKA